MDRRSFFKIFAALPVVGVAAMASAVKDTKVPDHVLKGNVVIEGSLVVNGIKTGTALAAGDYNPEHCKSRQMGMFMIGPRDDLPQNRIGDIIWPQFEYPMM